MTRRLTPGPPAVFGPSATAILHRCCTVGWGGVEWDGVGWGGGGLWRGAPTLTASSHSFMPLADMESCHATNLDALHFLCSCLFPAAERRPPLPGTRHCTLSVVRSPRARLICGAINSPSLRNLLTDIPHACLRSPLIMHLLAVIVAATRPHVCIDGGFGTCKVTQ